MNDDSVLLFRELTREKERLLETGQIKKQKSKIAVLDSDKPPFSIPENWCWVRLGDVSIIQEGPGIRKHQYCDEGVQFLTVTNILEGSVDLAKSVKHISNEEFESKYSHFQIDKGDIVVACSGGSWGKSAVFEDDTQIILNTSTLRLRFFGDLSDNRYLYYLTKTSFFKNQIASHSTGQQPNFGFSHYSIAFIPLPPKAEQKRIVAILDEAFGAIARAKQNAQQNLANARELFESYLNRVFSEKGEGWEETELGNLVEIKHGFAFKSQYFVDHSDYVLLTPGNFYEDGGYRDRGGKTKYYDGKIPSDFILAKGDFLVAMTEQAAGLLGSSLIVPKNNKFLHNQRLGLVQLKADTVWSNDFFHHAFNTKCFRGEVHASASGVKVRHTSPKKMYVIKMSFPTNLSEQQAVASRLDQVIDATRQASGIYDQKLAALDELKQSILQKAFTGQLTGKSKELEAVP